MKFTLLRLKMSGVGFGLYLVFSKDSYLSFCDNELSLILGQANAHQKVRRDSKDGVGTDFWI